MFRLLMLIAIAAIRSSSQKQTGQISKVLPGCWSGVRWLQQGQGNQLTGLGMFYSTTK